MSGIRVPRLAKGKGYKGPEHYGCYNTGMAPAIFHSRTGKYVVGPEIPCCDAIRTGACLLQSRTIKCSNARRTVWIFKGRKAAVSKFMALCGAQILENERQHQAHKTAAEAAAKGDLAAALTLGDY